MSKADDRVLVLGPIYAVRWSSEPPAASGWYWFLDAAYGGNYPEIVLFDHEMGWFDRLSAGYRRNSIHECEEKIPVASGLWSERIEKPEPRRFEEDDKP
jgi:hypothetical protein